MTDDDQVDVNEWYSTLVRMHPDPKRRLNAILCICVNEVGDRWLLTRVVRMAEFDAAPPTGEFTEGRGRQH